MICYKRLHKYKYRTTEEREFNVEITGETASTRKLELDPNGTLTIRKRYAWDGPSGPTIDTTSFMRGALVHDALYQLIRERQLPFECRDHADRLLRKMCLADGMWSFRAWYVYQAVKRFGMLSALPGVYKPDETICIDKGKYI